MSFTVFRADNRSPEQIASTGFQARVPLDAEVARQLIVRSAVDPNAPLNLPEVRGSTIYEYFNGSGSAQKQPALVGLPALYAEIRREKSGTTMHVSTSPDAGAGGYADLAGNLYRIDVPLDRMYAWDINSSRKNQIVSTPREIHALGDVHPAPDPRTGIGSSRPVLLTDTASIADARIVAVSNPNGEGEVAFLTGIPKEWIGQSRSQDGAWKAMPGRTESSLSLADAAAPKPQLPSSSASHSSKAPAAATAAGHQHPYADPADHANAMYRQALASLDRHPATAGIAAADKVHNAAALVDSARSATPALDRIDAVAPGKNGGLFAVQGQQGDPTQKYALLQSPLGLPAIQSASAIAAPAERAKTETPAEPSSVASLRQMFDQPQAGAPAAPAPRRH
ncbi:hypothetical protein K4L06_06175 [Lysobacter sp. BMK333-48F3]|uniref:XVIPCD domain-containing protein n=1 Tax=Lysobacter sp. BMK333-48F3 TaxID=2867962 RepID=UPI001C8BF428|nr:XVIPCD domain-containing protein [Lysobacter sp. BMK333-48F3]MBX9400893.1 hypothetical protein [Lysobacter sp. BMK333-48F3]